MERHGRSPVLILSGPHRGRTGTINGTLGEINPHVARVIVWFEDGGMTIVRVEDLSDREQLALDL